MQSARAIHRAAKAALGAQFLTTWRSRAPYSAFHPHFLGAARRYPGWPTPEQYDDLARAVPQAPGTELPRFVRQQRTELERWGGYEQHVRHVRAVPTRERSWHDFFNMAVWAHFPRVRWALNGLHVDDTLGPKDPRNGRAPQQNLAAQFDESGIVVASSSDSVLQELRALRFKRVLWERRQELLATTQFCVVGHGTLESLLTPHLGLACKAVMLRLDQAPSSYRSDELRQQIDARVAAVVESWRERACPLDPLPVLGIPDFADNARGDFYDDARYFRFQRRNTSI